jgi:HPt (histidine-containing phosphotransfer) domain-containing protein
MDFNPQEALARREARLACMRRDYLVSILSDLDQLKKELESVETAESGYRRKVHSIRGSGGAYGFPDISLRAGEAEDAFLAGAGNDELVERVVTLVGTVQQAREEFLATFDG